MQKSSTLSYRVSKRGSGWLAAGLLAIGAGPAAGQASEMLPHGRAAAATAVAAPYGSIAEWSRQVWSTATSDHPQSAIELLLTPPAAPAGAQLEALAAGLDLAKQNNIDWEAKRLTRVQELRTELATQNAEGDLIEALTSANELLELIDDRDKLLSDASIVKLAAEAEQAAQHAEAEEEWLKALELYSRLGLLYDIERTYHDDVERTAQRLQMLRLYVPQVLHDMQDAARADAGEEPLPPFNAVGEDWRVKLAGIDEEMVTRPIWIAAQKHVESVPLAEMLAGGFKAVRTLATTTALGEALHGLQSQQARAEFIDYLDRVIAQIEAQPRDETITRMFGRVKSLLAVSRETVGLPQEVVLHEFGNGAMGVLDDYSAIIWPDELKQFQRSIEGRFTGVGIQITLDDAQRLKVVTPLQGTPAAQAGIRAGDLIVEVDGQSTLGITLNQAVDRITGPEGSEVVLGIEREGQDEVIDITLTRAEIPITSVKGWERTGRGENDWDWFIDEANGIGYIRLTQFTNETTQDLHRAIWELKGKGLHGLILDLRYNPGGLLDEAVGVANTFLAVDGVIVSQEDGMGIKSEEQRARRSRAILPATPMVVLVNNGAASASEIVAGCLQDYDRAVIVGERSFGKGSVQNVFPMSQNQAMFKLTTQYYRLPDGRLIHRRPNRRDYGIKPDIVVDMLPEQMMESLKVRMDADVMVSGDEVEQVDPQRLLEEGLDPQLQTALLLLQSKVAVERSVRAAMR